MRRLADLILYVHWAWLLFMLASPFLLPWQLVLTMSAIVFAMNALNRWHCPVTQWEYRLRRKASETWIPLPFPGMSRKPGEAVVAYTVDATDGTSVREVYYVISPDEDGAYVQDFIKAETAMDRGLALLGITLSARASHVLTIVVLAGAPLLAWWWT